MTTLHTLEQRLRAVESRLADIEGGYGQTLYRLDRRTTRVEIFLERMAEQMGVAAPTDAEIDTRLDEA